MGVVRRERLFLISNLEKVGRELFRVLSSDKVEEI